MRHIDTYILVHTSDCVVLIYLWASWKRYHVGPSIHHRRNPDPESTSIFIRRVGTIFVYEDNLRNEIGFAKYVSVLSYATTTGGPFNEG